MVNCVFSFVALALVMVFTGSPLHWTILEVLYPLVTLFFFSLGVGLFLAAATVFFRDIMHIWSVFITALLYFSAIFYDCLLYTSLENGDQELCTRMQDTTIAVSRVLTVARRSAGIRFPCDR